MMGVGRPVAVVPTRAFGFPNMLIILPPTSCDLNLAGTTAQAGRAGVGSVAVEVRIAHSVHHESSDHRSGENGEESITGAHTP